MRSSAKDVIGALIDETVNSASPREGFTAELLLALKDMPVIPIPSEAGGVSHLRWIVPGAVAGVVGTAGALWYGLNRRSNRSKRRSQ
ncbi:MAG: hypothetical protein ACRDJV_13620 [Actinomycetota bacterium]